MIASAITRREALLVAAALPMVAGARAAEPKRKPIIDCHVHCFAGKASTRFPYHARAPYQPDFVAAPEDLIKCMDGAGTDFAVIVHPEPYQDDHRYLEYCLDVGKGRLKGTLLFFADQPGWDKAIPALVKKHPRALCTLRVHAYDPTRLPPFGKPELRAFWKLASDHGLALQLHFEPRYAPGFEPLIKAFPKTPVIIDHLGRPLQGTPEEHAVVIRWAKLPNTYLKLSAVPPPTQYPHRDVRPVIKDLAAAYGGSRMIMGGGFGSAGATPATYRATRETLLGYVAHLSAAERADIAGGTAARLFGFAG